MKIYAAYVRLTLDLKTHIDWKWKDEKRYTMQMKTHTHTHTKKKKKTRVALLISDKTDFKTKLWLVQNGRVEGCALTSYESTKINSLLNKHQQKDTGTHQKRYPTSKDKGEATMRQ